MPDRLERAGGADDRVVRWDRVVVIVVAWEIICRSDVDSVDDVIVDGTQTVTITATAAGHFDGSGTVDVTDDEAALTVTIAADSVSEADGAAATTATVIVTV